MRTNTATSSCCHGNLSIECAIARNTGTVLFLSTDNRTCLKLCVIRWHVPCADRRGKRTSMKQQLTSQPFEDFLLLRCIERNFGRNLRAMQAMSSLCVFLELVSERLWSSNIVEFHVTQHVAVMLTSWCRSELWCELSSSTHCSINMHAMQAAIHDNLKLQLLGTHEDLDSVNVLRVRLQHLESRCKVSLLQRVRHKLQTRN